MDTTQNETEDRGDDADATLGELEQADPADAPDIAERLADALTEALDEREPSTGGSHSPEGKATD